MGSLFLKEQLFLKSHVHLGNVVFTYNFVSCEDNETVFAMW